MLTTASITFSATSATNSGPRALAGVDSAGIANAAIATAANAGRRTCRAKRAKVPSMNVCAPGKLRGNTAPVRAWTQGRFLRGNRLVNWGGIGTAACVATQSGGAFRPLQPRINQISTTPKIADTMPAIRSDASGLSSALAASRLARPGKAAKMSPSMTNTRPRATTNSGMSRQSAPTADAAAQDFISSAAERYSAATAASAAAQSAAPAYWRAACRTDQRRSGRSPNRA